jgi:pimeloyl-ACP methyl ester carboxylesterase/streptogramin lyase
MRRFLIVLVVTLIASVGLSVPRAAGASALTRSNAAKAKMYTLKGVQVYGFLAVDAQGNVYSDSGTSSLVKLSPKGKVLATWDGLNFAADGPGSAAGVALDSQGNVFVVDAVANKVVKLSPSLQVLAQWGGYGTAPGQFIAPEGIALDAQGNIYVADTGNARIQKLAPDGSVQAVWNDGGKFRDPSGITLDTHGTVYVADPYFNQIFKLSPSGQEMGTLDSTVLAGYVIDLVVDSAGRVYAADQGSQHVLKFSAAGKYMGGWDSDTLMVFTLTGVARSPNGTIYASECPTQSGTALRCRIVKWSSRGKPTAIWNSGTQGTEPGSKIDMGGYGLQLYCTGQGSPTVILQSAFRAGAGEWGYLQPQLATQTRVCSYDRPGLGQSNALPSSAKIPGALQVAQQLHALLQKANVAGPYILAGHSLGGMFSRMFAATYPSDVVGMVMIDGLYENQLVAPGIWGNGETFDMDLSVQQIHTATKNTIKGSLGNIPLITLTENADLASCSDCYSPANQYYQFQAALASASSNSVQVMALRSGFGIPWNQPGLVVEAVREVIATARSANHALPACGAAFQQLGGKCMS